MTDLFQCTCPHCGQPMPDEQSAPFDTFWATVPKGKKNGSKEAARKAWVKLSPQERALAQERVAAFYSLSKEERIGAQQMHVSTYLNSKAFEEEILTGKMARLKPLSDEERSRLYVQAIKSGKRFACVGITATQARWLVEDGLVTRRECRAVGVL